VVVTLRHLSRAGEVRHCPRLHLPDLAG
jgi:hypothetical protein